nr:hypothetical protein BgiMline_023745 [Biomphalaria glabrata]
MAGVAIFHLQLLRHNNNDKYNLELVPMFQICCQRITQMKNSPSNLLTTDLDIFGEKIVFDEVHKSLLKTSDIRMLLNKLTSTLLSSIESVIQRQMQNYLSGPLSNPTEKILQDILSAPANNMHAEHFTSKSPLCDYWLSGFKS